MFIIRTILSIVLAFVIFLFGWNFLKPPPADLVAPEIVFEVNPNTEDFGVGVKKEQIIKLEVIKTEPLRVVKETVELKSSILTIPGIISWTNFFRQTNGAPAVKENLVLNAVALSKLEDMLSRQYFEHTSPSGDGAGDIAKKFNYEFVLIGENLAMGDFVDDEDVVTAWMNSPGHRANILKQAYLEIGVATKKGIFNGREVWMSVQTFATPLSFCPKPNDEVLLKIEANKIQLKSNKEHLDILREMIEEKKYQTREEYEKLVAEYNSLVPSYNFLSQSAKSLIQEYNSQITLFNQCVASIE